MKNIISLANAEAVRLLRKQGLKPEGFTDDYLTKITESIADIRAYNDGVFNETHLLPIIHFLDQQWEPDAMHALIDPKHNSGSPN